MTHRDAAQNDAGEVDASLTHAYGEHMGYGKIFESLFTGSMVGSGPTVFAVWSYVIANAKPPGTIELNPKILATVIGCDVAEIEQAIAFLCDPDPNSRTPEHQGRRLIREGNFLFAVPTWEKYNKIRNEQERRASNRAAQQRYRDKNRNGVSADVSKISAASAESAHEEVEADREEDSTEPAKAGRSAPCDNYFNAFWDAYSKKVDRPVAERAWRKIAPAPELATVIIEAAMAYARVTPDRQYRKNPATWLNARAWENEIVTAQAAAPVPPRNMPNPARPEPVIHDPNDKECPCERCYVARRGHNETIK